MNVSPLTAVRSRRRRGSLAASAVLASCALGITACGDSSSDTKTTAAPPPSVATAPVKVATTALGTVGYRSVGSGSPLVLIMGFGSSMEDWAPTFVNALAKEHRVIMFDNSGIGKTKAVAGTLTIPKMADQTSALIDKLGLGKPGILGWSMGGMIAQALVVRHPGQVGRLVLAASKPGNGEAKSISKATAAALNASPEIFLAALFPDDQKAALKAYTEDFGRYTTRATVPDATYGTQRAAINHWLAGDEPSGRKVTLATVRTLIGQGIQDKLSPLVNSRVLHKLFPNDELKLYDDAGHGFLFQEDTKFADKVDSFLGGG